MTTGDISSLIPTETVETATKEEKNLKVAEVPVKETPAKDEFLDLLLDRISPIGEAEKLPPLKMMIYSEPGVGKTTLVGQVPNNLIIDTEKGRITLEENKKHDSNMVAPGVAVLPYKTFEGLELAIKKFHEEPDALKNIETITIDTLNNLHKRGLEAVLEREWNKNPVSVNRYVPETEHHTENNELVRRLVQSMVDLDRNVIFIAHSKTVEPKNKPSKTYPDFSERLANTISAMVDVVGYMYMAEIEGEVHRVIRFRPTEGITAKSRLKQLPDNMIDPSWEKIWAAYSS